MAERENNTGIEKEKNSKEKIIMAVLAVLVLSIAIFSVAKVYNSPAKQLEKQLNLGNRYLGEMDYEQAIVAFDAAIQIDPKNADAYLGKADAYIGLGDSAMAIETLEAGYLETEGNETIRNRLFDIYAEMAEEAIEKGLYEEGKKAYECIVELGGENEELRKKLEELQDDGREKGNIVQADGQEEGELPYYELGFSPEDFTLAGYSVMDGDHLDDIVQVVAREIPHLDDVWGKNYEGWYRWGYSNEKSLLIEYMYDDSVIPDEAPPIEYIVATEEKIELVIGYTYSDHEYNNWPTDMLSKRPFFESKVIMDVSSYEDVMDILGIGEVVEQTKKKEKIDEYGYGIEYSEEEDAWIDKEFLWAKSSVFLFESQYGNTECQCRYYEESSGWECAFSTEYWSLTLDFGDDNILHYIRIESI